MEVIVTVTIVIVIVGVITHLLRGRLTTYLKPKWGPLFCLKFGPCFGGFNPQNRGRSQVPGTYIGVKNIFFFDFYEMFSGCGSLYKSFRGHGYVSQWYDKLQRGAVNDLSALGGLIVAIRDTLCIRAGGLLHGGHPCYGFVFMSSGTHWRHLCIMGHPGQPMVHTSNLLVARFSLILLLCIAIKVHFTVEQPSSSKLVYIPYIQHLLEALRNGAHFKRFWMGLYGHACPKPSW